MTGHVPDADRAARDRIRTRLTETQFVEAGAGTGKTSALVDRAVALVLDGVPIDRIVAITFTEKAAAELRDRVRGGLERAREEHPDSRERIDAALDSLDRAQMSTIHAFCRGLLQSYAAEAGVDPAFTVADEVAAERRFQERWRAFLETLGGDATAVAAFDRVLQLGMTPADIEKLVREIRARADVLPLLDSLTASADPPWPDLSELRGGIRELLGRCADGGDLLAAHLRELDALADRLARLPHERDATLASAGPLLTRSVRVGRRENWTPGGGVDQAREETKALTAPLLETLDALRSDALARLLPWICEFVRRDAADRAREGVMEFDDLILRVRDLLRDDHGARRRLRERFHTLLIDEFQDTDPLQVDLAMAFATRPETGQMEPGRLFVVGDPKQSIYRFRRADMAIYAHARETAERHGAAFPELTVSRRCRKPIVDWVNRVFEHVIGPGDSPEVQPPYRPISHAREDTLAGPGVAWFGEPVQDRAPIVRRLEAEEVARRCVVAVESGWQVADRDGTAREARFRDIAILIPTRRSLDALERALQRFGIPYRVEGGSLVYQTQEVRDLINCLTAIDDPADDVAIVGALRSPAFACSDVDIARFRAAGGRFEYLRPDLDRVDGPVADALRALRAYHSTRHDDSLAALVERFARDRGLVEIGVLDRGDRNAFRRVRFVADQARLFERDGPQSLRAFITWLERRAARATLDHEGAGVDDDEDAVRVLTIHGAKGLEFPIVVIAGLGTGPSSDSRAIAVDRATGQVAVRVGPRSRRFQLGPENLHDLEGVHEDAERRRLLYVAATRARDHLLVSLYHPERVNKECYAAVFIAAGARAHAAELSASPDLGRRAAAPWHGMQVDLPSYETVEAFQEARRALASRAARRRYASATALGRLRRDAALDEERPQDDTEPWARGKGATRLGRAVHATIQSVSLDADDATVDAFARAQAVAEAIPDRASEVARLARCALESEAASRARVAPRALREAPFAVRLGETVLEGFVDLIIDTPDGIEIVDWKTDRVTADEVTDRLRSYELQAGLYTLGVEAATGRPVRRVTYVFVQPGVERSPGDPAELASRARAELEAFAAASGPP